MEVLKNWILNRPFVVRWVGINIDIAIANERPKVFSLAQKDILETMRDDLDKQANELADKKLENLLTVVDYSQIVGQKGETIYIGGKPADEALLSNLRAEAKFILESELWKLISETPKELAQRAMFKDDGQLENLLLKGRAVLYTLATQKKIVDLFNAS